MTAEQRQIGERTTGKQGGSFTPERVSTVRKSLLFPKNELPAARGGQGEKPSDAITDKTSLEETQVHLIADFIQERAKKPITVQTALRKARAEISRREADWAGWKKPRTEIAGMLLDTYLLYGNKQNGQKQKGSRSVS